jgi:hypothetical protein
MSEASSILRDGAEDFSICSLAAIAAAKKVEISGDVMVRWI